MENCTGIYSATIMKIRHYDCGIKTFDSCLLQMLMSVKLLMNRVLVIVYVLTELGTTYAHWVRLKFALIIDIQSR